MLETAAIDLASPGHKSDPFPLYAQLRAEHPVHRVHLGSGRQAWLVSRYDDVAAVLKDRRFVKDRNNTHPSRAAKREFWLPGFARALARNMLDVDGADHIRLRGLANKAFIPSATEGLRDRIRSLALERAGELRGAGTVDLISGYAQEIPSRIIAEMLAVPTEDCSKFVRWTRTGLSGSSSRWRMAAAIPALWRFLRYVRRLVRDRRRCKRGLHLDLLESLIVAQEGGDRLSEDELVAMVFLLLVAGHETTVNLIGNGMLALFERPEQMTVLREDPSLMASGVEELLRYAGPLDTATERYASEDLDIAGVSIPRGALVLAGLASANRDESRFEEADRLDVGRSPNPHLAFGLGPHYCLGATLARLEAEIAISTLLEAIPRARLACPAAALRWRPGLALRGMVSLPVRVA